MSARLCPCGTVHDPGDLRVIGGQVLGEGDVVVLGNARCCGATFAIGEVTDAAVCADCKRVLVGNVMGMDGVKVVECPAWGEVTVRCEGCAQRALGPEAFSKPPRGLRERLPRSARMYG